MARKKINVKYPIIIRDLIDDVQEIKTSGGSSKNSNNIIKITHKELVNLRDTGKLIPGTNYRITDYVATTTDPESRSANHPFDIIVVADDEQTLNENARAIAHEGDTYFEKCNLAAWQLKYCIDNDTTRFSWAQEEFDGYAINMEGDWYGCILVSSQDTTHEGYPYHLRLEIEGEILDLYSGTLESEETEMLLDIEGEVEECVLGIAYRKIDAGKGVIYRMIDENNNDIPYDFKGIQFKRYKVTECNRSKSLVGMYASNESHHITVDEEDFRWCYLFNVMFGNENKDDSVGFYLSTPSNCKAGRCSQLMNGVCNIDGDRHYYNSYSWTCGVNCYYWTCGDNCSGWTCGDNCSGWTCNSSGSWTCGDNCNYWLCGDNSDYWTCGNQCSNWSCGKDCPYWVCGHYSHSWTCRDNCSGWTCGDNCNSWVCGDRCYHWTCGNQCSNWSCNIGCYYWTCGNNCSSWTCYTNCSSWSCGNYCSNWICPNNCFFWVCGNNCSNWTLQNDNCQYFNILDGVNGVTIPFVANNIDQQVAGMKSDGTVRVWNPADE